MVDTLELLHDAPKDKEKEEKKEKKSNKIVPQTPRELEMKSFMQTTDEFQCFICGKNTCKGGVKCPMKNKPKAEWTAHIAMKRMDQSFAQTTQDTSGEMSSITQT